LDLLIEEIQLSLHRLKICLRRCETVLSYHKLATDISALSGKRNDVFL
jgi:hypothetical protein